MSAPRWLVGSYALLCAAQIALIHRPSGPDGSGLVVIAVLIVVRLERGWILFWVAAVALALLGAVSLPLGLWGTLDPVVVVFWLLSLAQLVVLLRRPLRGRCWSRAPLRPA